MTPHARSPHPRRRPSRLALVPALVAAVALGACGGSDGDGDEVAPDDADGATAEAGSDAGAGGGTAPGGDPDDAPAPLPGDIARYGALNVGDEAGEASEVVAAFFALSEGVAPGAFGAVLDPSLADCRVSSGTDGRSLGTISAGLLPEPEGVQRSSIGAGETITLSSGAGTWAELQPGGALGGVSFYDLASGTALPTGPVPADLSVDVPGDDFPAFAGVALADAAPLVGFRPGPDGTIDPGTRFSWEPSGDPDARVRIVSATTAGFFADDGGITVACTVPDTGEFAFDDETRAALGEDFEGTAPAASRIAIATATEGDALLILVRESEAVQTE